MDSNVALMTKEEEATVEVVESSSPDDHFANCRVAVKILDAANIPSSISSVSDPDSCLSATVWCGGIHETINNEDKGRVQQATCSSNMEGPRFDTELIFPLSVESIDDILSGQVVVTLTDVSGVGEVGEGEMTTTKSTDVGQVKIPFELIFKDGKTLSSCTIIAPKFYTLTKTKNMTRKAGSPKVRMSLSFFPGG